VPPILDRLLYIDDSGRPQAGLAVFGWIEFAPHDWSAVLATWLTLRKRLWREFRIPVTQELHTSGYVHGRGRITAGLTTVHGAPRSWKEFGRQVARECLDTMRCTQGLTVGAVYRHGPPAEFARTKQRLYVSLLERLDDELRASGSLGMIFIDGDGSDGTFRAAHRRLEVPGRQVVEDAIHVDSASSQLIQMADLVAWCANATIDHAAANEFARDWYDAFLAERDHRRHPIAL
jgi:hypothetical protein